MELIDLAAIARETASLLLPIAEERKIELVLELAPAPCRADADRVSQILLNLLTNALDHTPADGRITLRTMLENGCAIFTIADTGLGLAICRAIADAHGGTLEVRSEEGRGSTVTLRIPASPATG